MSVDSLVFILAGFVIALLAINPLWRRLLRWTADWLPPDLRGAQLVYAERLFTATEPFLMTARLDRAYRDKKGIIILLELKTRMADRSYLSDVIELSVQRLALMASGSDLVADYGYVVVQRSANAKRISHRVKLLPSEDIIALVQRREALLSGQAIPTFACAPGLCQICAFKEPCSP